MVRNSIAIFFLVGLFIYNVKGLRVRSIGITEFFLWQIGIAGLLAFTISGKLAEQVSRSLGFTLIANFVFTIILLSLLVIVRIQSRKISLMRNQIQDLVQKLATDVE